MALLTALMPRNLRRRIDDWIEQRNPRTREPILLHNKRVYILPTRFGYLYAVMLFVLMLAAINYQNSMAFVMTFLLTAIGIVSLWQTHKNLLGLSIELKTPQPVFQGEHLELFFKLGNPLHATKFALGIQYLLSPPVYARVNPDDSCLLQLTLPANQRGVYTPAGITIFTRYPTGLFHAWGVLRFDAPILIYPAPRYDLRLRQALMEGQSGGQTVDTSDGDDFAGLREHRTGESLRHISWKAYAQGRGMLTKTFQSHASPAIWINWDDMTADSIDGKLGQMTALIVQAEQDGRKYGMKLPNLIVEQETGPSHRAYCLQQLATSWQRNPGAEYAPTT